jgi:DNA-binding MarR family transcriptional regulator
MDFGYRNIEGLAGSPYGAGMGGHDAASPGNATDSTSLQLSVRRARGLRDLRRKLLGADCFSGPAWDVLLYMFESHVLQRRDTIGNICDGIEIPATTALRWINRLAELGLITIRDDHLDNRRRFAQLSVAGADRMTRYFAGIAPHLLAA